jgi:hypothetical protein
MVFGDPYHVLPNLGVSGDDVAFAELLARENNQPYERPTPFDREPFRHAVNQLVERAVGSPTRDTTAFANQAAGRYWLRKFGNDAEKVLVADFQQGLIPLSGRPHRQWNGLSLTRAERVSISYLNLLGEVILNSPIHAPSQSWLFVRDPAFLGAENAWRDVWIPADELKRLHPTPLTRLGVASRAESNLPVDSTTPHHPEAASVVRSKTRASVTKIHQVIADVYDYAAEHSMKPPNLREIPKAVLRRLEREGSSTSEHHIQKLAKHPQYQGRRLTAGKKSAGKFQAFFDLEI